MTDSLNHLTLPQLEAGLDEIRGSPRDEGVLKRIVRRPRTEQREILRVAELDLVEGLVGDNWKRSRCSVTPDGSPHPDMQLTLMNSRAIALIARQDSRWQLAGDQLFIDLDLSVANLPPGTQLAIGSAVIQITDQPHTGCRKFAARFGQDAMRFVNSPVGRQLNLRGLNARIVRAGTIRVGDVASISRNQP